MNITVEPKSDFMLHVNNVLQVNLMKSVILFYVKLDSVDNG